MCDPATLIIASTAVTAASKLTSGMVQASQQRYAANVADQRAKFAADQAKDAITEGQLADRDLQRKTAQQMGAQRAAAAASGLDVGFGSAAQAQDDIAMLGQDALDRQRRGTASQIRGYDVDGWSNRASAIGNRAAARGTMLDAAFGTASSILGGATNFSKQFSPEKWEKIPKPPAFPGKVTMA
ncbi:hypothetical protein [Flavisphingomonas formosensis]|uniref:hypothetical protein n=1 Tax=Flavisphingomonas formosensis TaxID=861534 RepID=UPI0012FA0CC8|nr:hypothetical protein [Sphingomonas formosensis]